MFRRGVGLVAVILFHLANSAGQDGEIPTFGTTVFIPGGLTGKIYHLPVNTLFLPDLGKFESVGTIYAKALWVPVREFTEGFPGITDRVEWFGIDFSGRFYIRNPGKYRFHLCSDDGSALYIDNKMRIDNRVHHPFTCVNGTVDLAGGIHQIRVPYFQGSGYALGLTLAVAGPAEKNFRPFSTDEFSPPTDPKDWKFGNPQTIEPPPVADPDAGRVKLKDVVHPPEPQVVIPLQVLSKGQVVGDLKPSDLIVRDEGEPQAITALTFRSQRLDIMFLVDASLAHLAVDEINAPGRLDAHDRVGVVLFGERQLMTLELSENREMLLAALRKLPSYQSSNALKGAGNIKDINGALVNTISYLKDKARPDATAAIIILSDNAGSRGGISDRGLRDALWQNDIVVSAVLTSATEHAGDADVRQFVDATGGNLLVTSDKNAPLPDALRGLRERYLVTTKPPVTAKPRTIRKITVEVTRGGAEVRARTGYVVPALKP